MRARILWMAMLLLACTAVGCAQVKPYQREYLADRIMDPAASSWELSGERKLLSTREGALGGSLGAGGGCACN
ncbi:MAG: DUF4266 domain-containing protein [Candidatus Latescibacterota bacterium]|nr:MAG: DUF4266 domain-containing protein [Candidatus Latescibacterota bacterium]